MKRVTLRDIAKKAGVSIATVSWAINNNKNVRIPLETRNRIQKIAQELGYKKNALASELVSGETKFIGFITDDVATTPFAGQIIQGAQDEAWKSGKILLIVNTDGKDTVEQAAFNMMEEYRVQGIIYSTWYHHPLSVPDYLLTVPSILVNCFDKKDICPSVVPDEFQGGYDATKLLINAGHKKIAFFNTTSPSPAKTDRLKGYRTALEESKIEFNNSLVFNVTPNQEGGYNFADSLIKSGATAVFCHNDRVAMGLYDALNKRISKSQKICRLLGSIIKK
ncbi:hypothetical protein Q757_04135 [Oenococcus alcoholitolerans]|uniref:HTH lacI-type domain-containing protein n=1 Tax=Oenococcus alcoholitolerans TaxID=931074 RepID=A0ABR4XR34_9LACO|nr:hypothetical protein Q757_04135 [Oenococcus alcoholitolerans]